jgi:hypothetical protein
VHLKNKDKTGFLQYQSANKIKTKSSRYRIDCSFELYESCESPFRLISSRVGKQGAAETQVLISWEGGGKLYIIFDTKEP